MKKMKKLNLNKVRIVSLRNLQKINGGTNANPPTIISLQSCDPNIDCESTGDTYSGGNNGDGGRTFKSGTENPQSHTCSMILTECELADM
ncbi:hypothetical protein [uncultured Kordia sp.]|uniref:hypothetical protein n=1 Tax=uncultured Kordia sp. TaxID=507699 RepID=UPI0026258F56|nr:hypothetical protein [uncultured Kordia sp.]